MHFIRTIGYTLSNHKRNEEIMKELQIPQQNLYNREGTGKNTHGKTPEMMEGLCFVTSITSLNRHDTGKDDENELKMLYFNSG
jgi:hypothetical protein